MFAGVVAVAFFRTAYGVSTKVGLLEGAKINKMPSAGLVSWLAGLGGWLGFLKIQYDLIMTTVD